MLLWRSKHDSKFILPREWFFTEPEHGKSDCDGLGAGIKKMLWVWCATSETHSPRMCQLFMEAFMEGCPHEGDILQI